ncbi:hypothetical protein HK096_010982 [Nowakowskiella sp. JEL0078]|nr:hypothetical protein HK096_010982 [Nowakowskiella sp. JEL0078]
MTIFRRLVSGSQLLFLFSTYVAAAQVLFSNNTAQPLCNTVGVTMDCTNFAPQDGHIIMGWNVDLDRHDTVANMLARMDAAPGGSFSSLTSPGAYGMFMKVMSAGLVGQTPTQTPTENLDDVLAQLKGTNTIFVTTLDPDEGYAQVTDATLQLFANKMAEFNNNGIPVLVRPAHEMNGPWGIYGQQPSEFKAFYIKVYTLVKAVAPHVKFNSLKIFLLVFAPNLGSGYPWPTYTPRAAPTPSAANLLLLDTNGNGQVDVGDDPYMPYYPGDQYVDWFGLSVYWKGTNDTVNSASPAGYLSGLLNLQLGGNISTYEFARQRNLPIIIPETAGSFCPDHLGVTNLQTKQQFWTDLFGPSLRTQFPLLKMALWFDYSKYEDVAERDFSISNHNATHPTTESISQVAPQFKQDLKSFTSVVYSNNMALASDGSCGCFGVGASVTPNLKATTVALAPVSTLISTPLVVKISAASGLLRPTVFMSLLNQNSVRDRREINGGRYD